MQEEFDMRVIYTSDLHSYLFPTDYCSVGERNIGYYRIIESYKKDEDTVVIDCGDNLQGSVLSKYVMDKKLFHPFPQAKALKEGRVDFLVPGNHDHTCFIGEQTSLGTLADSSF